MRVTDAQANTATAPWPLRPYRIVPLDPGQAWSSLPPEALCAIQYGAPPDGMPQTDDPRRAIVPLPPLDQIRGGELWLGSSPARFGRDGAISFAENSDVLFAHLAVSESSLAGDLTAKLQELYADLMRFVEQRGFPQLIRVWNYLGEINAGEGDAERYRQFCVGRFAAVSGARSFEARLPAASAIGSAGGGFTLIALASRRPGLQVENPNQVSAFRYPRSYGVRSPSFSRATLLPWADGPELLVSGTASIVGHATAHAGDPIAQLRQTASNLEVLRAHAVHTYLPGTPPQSLEAELYTLYLRDPAELPGLRGEIARLFGDAPLQVLRGDICRRELLIEVEAIYRVKAGGARPPC